MFMFISILYMFRASMFPSSGELIVSIRHLVFRYTQIRSKDSQIKIQLVLWIFYLEWQGDNMFRPLSPGRHQVTSK
jgi:hypothetical protein